MALMILAFAGTAGFLIRWLGLRIQAFLRIGKDVSGAGDAEPNLVARLADILELPDDETEAVKILRHNVALIQPDFNIIRRQFVEPTFRR